MAQVWPVKKACLRESTGCDLDRSGAGAVFASGSGRVGFASWGLYMIDECDMVKLFPPTSPVMSVPDQNVTSEVSELHTTFYVGLASFTVLVWDHLLTLSEEIEFIWKKQKGPLMYLFFINRYLTPLGFCVNLIGSMTVIGINVTALMMFLRIYAIYEGRKPVVILVAVLLLVEFSVNAWLLTYGIACTMIFDQSKVHGAFAAASAWLPLLYETVILVLTLLRTYQHARDASTGRVMRILVREGLFYFSATACPVLSVIFTITFILTLMILLAPDGLKNVAAQTEYLLTVAMMSRITLHLKKQIHGGSSHSVFLSAGEGGPSLPLSTHGTDGLDITIQQVSVMHDDHGDVIDMPKTPNFAASSTRSQTHSPRFEWHELRPIAPLRLNVNGSRPSSVSSQQQRYKRLP
ncbi:hypothetical protein LXA43DRAFT_1062298 [Ganoderma leucocontextum]|nr:hypothetical protein LXA43DRAFT_1062298 [Ganoderma leucocontextum]